MKTIIWGRDDGIRSKLRGLFSGGSTPVDTSPDSAYSAPSSNSMSGVMVGGATKMEAPKDVNPPDGYEVVLHKDALAPGEVTEVIIGGTAIAICNIDGTFSALTNSCPVDAGCPLGEGDVVGESLRCAYHGWTFDPATGRSQTNPDVTIPVYSVVIEGDAVCVKL